jgi:hypothetical protein
VGQEFYFAYCHFQALSNELSSPAILACPADTRLAATNFAALQNSNISYCISVCAKPSRPDLMLAGDRNIKIGSFESLTILPCGANENDTLHWTREMHQFKGNILFTGGQVEEWNNAALASGAKGQPAGTDLVLPSVPPSPSSARAPSSAGYRNYYGANPGVETPPPAAIPAPPPTQPSAHPPERPGNNSYVGQSRFSQKTTGQPEAQRLPDMTQTNSSSSFSATAPDGGTVTQVKTEPATPTFDQHIVKTLRHVFFWVYLLVLVIFLLLLAFKARQRTQRRREQQKEPD